MEPYDTQTLDCTGGAHAVPLARASAANFCYVSWRAGVARGPDPHHVSSPLHVARNVRISRIARPQTEFYLTADANVQVARTPPPVDQSPVSVSGTHAESAAFSGDTKLVRIECDTTVSFAFGRLQSRISKRSETPQKYREMCCYACTLPQTPPGISPIRAATETAYNQLATTNNWALVDWLQRYGSWTAANNAGLMYDQYHPNATMYAQMGNYLAEILKAV